MKKIHLLASAAIAVCMSAGVAGAQTTITFNSVPSVGTPIVTSVTTQGFTFTSVHFHTVDTFYPSTNVFNANGTTYIGEEGASLGGPITMSNGGVFSLNGFDAGQFLVSDNGYPNATTINVLGNFFGGGTISASFGISSTFASFLVNSSWTNLTSVVFSGSIVGGSTNAGIGLDNIVVNGSTTTTTPEPSSVALVAAGLAGMFAVARRRRA